MSELRAPVFKQYLELFPETIAERPMVVTVSEALCDLIADFSRRYEVSEFSHLAPPPFEWGWIEWASHPIGERVAASVWGAKGNTPPEAWIWKQGERGVKALGAFALQSNHLVSDRSHPNFEAIAGTLPGWVERDGNGDITCDGQAELWNRWWIATCAVLAAPGVRTVDERVRDKALRKSAVQTAPLVTYRCVDIDIDKLAGIPESMGGPASNDGRGGGVALHHVRGHLRLTEKGLIPVRPHWRGDASRGTRYRDRNILRNEELQPNG